MVFSYTWDLYRVFVVKRNVTPFLLQPGTAVAGCNIKGDGLWSLEIIEAAEWEHQLNLCVVFGAAMSAREHYLRARAAESNSDRARRADRLLAESHELLAQARAALEAARRDHEILAQRAAAALSPKRRIELVSEVTAAA